MPPSIPRRLAKTKSDQALADARLFTGDALAAAKAVMSGKSATSELSDGGVGTAYHAVFALLAIGGLWPELAREITS